MESDRDTSSFINKAVLDFPSKLVSIILVPHRIGRSTRNLFLFSGCTYYSKVKFVPSSLNMVNMSKTYVGSSAVLYAANALSCATPLYIVRRSRTTAADDASKAALSETRPEAAAYAPRTNKMGVAYKDMITSRGFE